jgi:hypothetical protein
MNVNEEHKEAIKSAADGAVDGAKDVIHDVSQQLTKEWIQAQRNEKGALDIIQEKLISRKLLVFITATTLMWFGLDPSTWGMIAMTYIGGQTAIDFAKVWRGE